MRRRCGGGAEEVTAGNFLPSSSCFLASIRVSLRLAIKPRGKKLPFVWNLCVSRCQLLPAAPRRSSPLLPAPPCSSRLLSARWHRLNISVLLSVLDSCQHSKDCDNPSASGFSHLACLQDFDCLCQCVCVCECVCACVYF